MTAALALLLAVSRAWAGEPVALAMAVHGHSQPQIEHFSELQRGARVQLDADTELTFVHYAACLEVTVRGGRLRLLGRSFELRGGRVLDERTQACPQTLQVSGNGVAAGMLLRNPRAVRLSTAPSFVLVGAVADTVQAVRVRRADGRITALRLEGRHAIWPSGEEPLSPGAEHTLEVSRRGGSAVAFPLTSTEATNVGAAILRLD